MDKNTFKINNMEFADTTMQYAIDMARDYVLRNNRPAILSARKKNGSRLPLATYSPIAPGAMMEYHENPGDTDSPIVPQVNVDIIFGPVTDQIVRKMVAYPDSDGNYRLFINGKKDPKKRVFTGLRAIHFTPKNDVSSWFENMKDHGFFPYVDKLVFAEI